MTGRLFLLALFLSSALAVGQGVSVIALRAGGTLLAHGGNFGLLSGIYESQPDFELISYKGKNYLIATRYGEPGPEDPFRRSVAEQIVVEGIRRRIMIEEGTGLPVAFIYSADGRFSVAYGVQAHAHAAHSRYLDGGRQMEQQEAYVYFHFPSGNTVDQLIAVRETAKGSYLHEWEKEHDYHRPKETVLSNPVSLFSQVSPFYKEKFKDYLLLSDGLVRCERNSRSK